MVENSDSLDSATIIDFDILIKFVYLAYISTKKYEMNQSKLNITFFWLIAMTWANELKVSYK